MNLFLHKFASDILSPQQEKMLKTWVNHPTNTNNTLKKTHISKTKRPEIVRYTPSEQTGISTEDLNNLTTGVRKLVLGKEFNEKLHTANEQPYYNVQVQPVVTGASKAGFKRLIPGQNNDLWFPQGVKPWENFHTTKPIRNGATGIPFANISDDDGSVFRGLYSKTEKSRLLTKANHLSRPLLNWKYKNPDKAQIAAMRHELDHARSFGYDASLHNFNNTLESWPLRQDPITGKAIPYDTIHNTFLSHSKISKSPYGKDSLLDYIRSGVIDLSDKPLTEEEEKILRQAKYFGDPEEYVRVQKAMKSTTLSNRPFERKGDSNSPAEAKRFQMHIKTNAKDLILNHSEEQLLDMEKRGEITPYDLQTILRCKKYLETLSPEEQEAFFDDTSMAFKQKTNFNNLLV